MNEPRVYKNSPFIFGLLILIFGVLFFALFFNTGFENLIVMIPFALLFGIFFLFILFSVTSQTIISDDEISIKSLLGAKSLRWSDISRVSGRGYGIKLHNFDGDVTVAPSPQLPGYQEVVGWIGAKRPDLFNPLEYGEMSRSWLNAITSPLVGLMFIGFGLFIFSQENDTFFPILIMLVIGVVFIGIPFTSPRSISIQNRSIVISYFFDQKTLLADEVASIDFRYTQTRNGKNYFVAVNLVNRKTIRISGLNPGLPVVYLVLKNWHRKNAQIGLTTQ